MKTENLIDALVVDGVKNGRPMTTAIASALVVGGLLSLAAFFVTLGIRPDIMTALATWRFDLKVGMVLAALVVAFGLCIAVSRPLASRPGRHLLPLAALALASIAVELVILPGAAWGTRLVGSNAFICMMAIPTLSLAPLAAVLMALRGTAPASPALAGAAAGFLAATAGATLYAFHCFDDSPLFVATWYALATVPVIVIGAVAGQRLLRW